ncbi:uncharacterized protein LOC122088276 [Macadamia integrifolia]|uniref:uncharacterized protein LOC122088276 n=1 Tax=Macadamia integrifolia TaxID=60698 RepID=UPI001C5001E0|nr:uncharacterized protein LOC122088276 [Macadamia integrifolia]
MRYIMLSASVNDSIRGSSLKFINVVCYCQKRVLVRISENVNSKHRLHYCCPNAPHECGFFSWCDPVEEPRVNLVTQDNINPTFHKTDVSEISQENRQMKEEIRILKKRMKKFEKYVGTLQIVIVLLVVVIVVMFMRK